MSSVVSLGLQIAQNFMDVSFVYVSRRWNESKITSVSIKVFH